MKLYIACPSYDGKASIGMEKSLKKTLSILPPDIEVVDFDIEMGCCYLPIARNKLVKRFMDSEADTFLFLDADISWPHPNQFIDFLQVDVEVAAGLYRYKQWEVGFPCHIYCDDNGIPISHNGLIKAEGVPTGCLKIQRKAFERMIDFYGESLEVDTPDKDLNPQFAYWNFFDTEKVGRTWMGEDYNFCRYYIGAGGEIWVYPNLTICHHGRVLVIDRNGKSIMRDFNFTGNYHEFMTRKPGGIKEGPVKFNDYKGNDIDGWMSPAELEFLYHESSKYDSVVEIGSYKGRSTHAFLTGLAKKVICIDPWAYNSTEENIFSGNQEYKEFCQNIAKIQGLNGKLKVLREYSKDAINDIEPVDMTFIDGDHDYEAVKQDIELYLPKTKKLICGHDYGDWPGVNRAVEEKFGEKFNLLDTIWYVEL